MNAALQERAHIVAYLDDAAQSAGMPVDQQLRFRAFLDQISGARQRADPLPAPPANGARA